MVKTDSIIELMNRGDWPAAINEMPELFDPIVNNNNLFHFACIRGNAEVIKQFLATKSIRLYDSNDDGDTGCHLLAKNEWSDMLCEIVETFPKFLKMRNSQNRLILYYTLDRPNLFKSVFALMKKNNYCKYLNTMDTFNRTIILDIIDRIQFDNLNYTDTIREFCSCGVNMNYPVSSPPLMYAIAHKMYDIAHILISECNVNVNVKNIKFTTPLIMASQHNNVLLCAELLNNGADVNYGGAENDFLPIIIAIKNGYWDLCKLITSYKEFDFDQKDKNLNIAMHHVIDAYLRLKMPESLIIDFIKHSDIMSPNITNTTPIHLLAKYNLLTKFHDVLKTKKLDIHNMNKFNQTPLSYSLSNSEKTTEKLEKLTLLNSGQNISPILKIVHPPGIKSNFGLFNADIIHNALYTLYLLNTYDTLTIPCQSVFEDKKIWNIWKIENQEAIPVDPIGNLFIEVIAMYMYNLFSIIPYVIFWHSKDLHYVFDQTKMYLSRAIKHTKRFVLLKLTIFPHTSITHANIVLYDKVTNTARRFEPYGDWEYMDTFLLDTHIKKLISHCLPDEQQTTFKYLMPRDYLHKTQFQLASLDYQTTNKKLGDPVGYCLAWCFWFVEMKLKNPDIPDEELVTKGLEDIINDADKKDTNPLLTYIRNYAVHLDNEKNKILAKIGIPENDYYELSYTDNRINQISSYVENRCKELLR